MLKEECCVYRAKAMQVIENAQGWYVEVQHGSGPGRSYGGGFAFEASGETLRGSETLHYEGPFPGQNEAKLAATEANKYYDGSDYDPKAVPA
jgi:hypothetical protein